ncbi:MAG TPA: hypothetical protein VF290_23080 [Pyrinomonadaceae bacterium]
MYLTKTKSGRRLFSLVAIAVFSFAFTPIGTRTAVAAPSVQVVFSGTGLAADGSKVEFWIWCMPEGNSPTYTGACRGSVLIAGQGPASGVGGFVVENPDGTYVARVFSINPNTFLVAAVFHNIAPEPAHGPVNLVAFGILNSNGATSTGLSRNSVVVVTGPGN